jgi:hypothetical protein
MAIRGNVTLTDAASTPVNRVYKPQPSKQQGIILYRDYTQDVFAGQNVLTVAQRAASKQARSNKISWKLECPILEQTAEFGPQTLAFANLGTIELVLHERSTVQNRKDLLSQLRDLIDEAIVTSQVQDLDFIY